MTAFLIIGPIFALGAALVHIFIFTMESVLWLRPSTYSRFGIKTDDEAATIQPMAFNQGFYNLFLAVGAIVGDILILAGATDVGIAVALFAVGCMLLAALVLLFSNPKLASAAVTQGAAPLVAVVMLVLAAVTR